MVLVLFHSIFFCFHGSTCIKAVEGGCCRSVCNMETTTESDNLLLEAAKVTANNPVKVKVRTLIGNKLLNEDGHMVDPSGNYEVNFEMYWHPKSTLLDVYGLFEQT